MKEEELTVTRSTKQKRRTVQIFVKVDECKAFPLEVSPNDKVSDIVKRIPSSACDNRHDVHVTYEGRERRVEELRDRQWKHCPVHDQDARWRKKQSQEHDETRTEVRGRAEERQGSGDAGVHQRGSDPDVGRKRRKSKAR